MILTTLFIIAVLIIGLVIVVAMQPSDFKIVRSATIPASSDAVFAEINDFHHWLAWSPWARLDPAAKNTFEGVASGEGAIFHWVGNKAVGEGRMTLLESRPYQFIRIKLEFLKPFVATHTAEFTFEPSGDQTILTWSMYGKNGFVSKAFGLFMNCDKMVGDQFQKGLENLKSVVIATAHR